MLLHTPGDHPIQRLTLLAASHTTFWTIASGHKNWGPVSKACATICACLITPRQNNHACGSAHQTISGDSSGTNCFWTFTKTFFCERRGTKCSIVTICCSTVTQIIVSPVAFDIFSNVTFVLAVPDFFLGGWVGAGGGTRVNCYPFWGNKWNSWKYNESVAYHTTSKHNCNEVCNL